MLFRGGISGFVEGLSVVKLATTVVAAVGAALVEVTVAPVIGAEGVVPHVVLVLAVVCTIAAGLDSGLAWAVAGGLALDVLAPRPPGSTAFMLVLAVGASAAAAGPLARVRPIAPALLVAVLSPASSLVVMAALVALRAPVAVDDPVSSLLTKTVLDVSLAGIVGLAAITARDKRLRVAATHP